MNMTRWLTNQSSPTLTNSQIDACDCTRVRADHRTLLNVGERPDKTVVADLAAIQVAGLDQPDARPELDIAYASVM
jgi:hypothetical protein